MVGYVLHSYNVSKLLTVGANVRPTTVVGQGSGVILLAALRCTGAERRLYDCPHSGVEVNSCSHSSDAGVICVPGKLPCWFCMEDIIFILTSLLLCYSRLCRRRYSNCWWD